VTNDPITDVQLAALAGDLGAALVERKLTVAAAESCTGGWIAKVLTDKPGSSAWFSYGVVTYSNQAKQRVLGVTPATLERYGAVSQRCVQQMVNGVVKLSGARVAVAVSGVAGPEGGSDDKPGGTVWFAFRWPGERVTERMSFQGDREAVRRRAVEHALRRLRKGIDHWLG
jgi:nicotinamide-nucleotide amidase